MVWVSGWLFASTRVERDASEVRDNRCYDLRKRWFSTLCFFTKSLHPVPICRQLQTGSTRDESANRSPWNETPEKPHGGRAGLRRVRGRRCPTVDPGTGVFWFLLTAPVCSPESGQHLVKVVELIEAEVCPRGLQPVLSQRTCLIFPKLTRTPSFPITWV